MQAKPASDKETVYPCKSAHAFIVKSERHDTYQDRIHDMPENCKKVANRAEKLVRALIYLGSTIFFYFSLMSEPLVYVEAFTQEHPMSRVPVI